MTDTTATLDPAGGHADHDHGGHGLTDKGYVRIAIILAVITAAEVAWSYLPIWDDKGGAKSILEDGGLIAMMIVKFGMVAGFFMHLNFDNKLLTRVFYFGLFLAVGVYIAVLTTFRIWGSL